MVISKVSSPLIWQLFSDCLESHEYKQQIGKCGKTKRYQEVRDEVRAFFLRSLREIVPSSFLHGEPRNHSQAHLLGLGYGSPSSHWPRGVSRRHISLPEFEFQTPFSAIYQHRHLGNAWKIEINICQQSPKCALKDYFFFFKVLSHF